MNGFPKKWAAIARDLADEPTGDPDARAGANVRQTLHDLTPKATDRIIGIVGGLIDPEWWA